MKKTMDPEKPEKKGETTSRSEYVPPDLFELGDAKELTRGHGGKCADAETAERLDCPADL